MIVLQPQIDARAVKVDWYFADERPKVDDGSPREVHPSFILNERYEVWSSTEW
jgi:hypothetical protein